MDKQAAGSDQPKSLKKVGIDGRFELWDAGPANPHGSFALVDSITPTTWYFKSEQDAEFAADVIVGYEKEHADTPTQEEVERRMAQPGEGEEVEASWFNPNTPGADPEIFKAQAAGTLTLKTIVDMAVQASTGYTDTLGTARAATLMGMASAALWKKAVSEAWKAVGKEAHEKIEHLTKWGTVAPSEAACRDIIIKCLAEKGIYQYPEIVTGVLGKMNPFQERLLGPETHWPLTERK